MISIIIPFRDHVILLDRCIRSIFAKTRPGSFEILLVNNQSAKPETEKFIVENLTRPNIRLIDYEYPFNFSAINNLAANEAAGEHLLFLNNDTEVIAKNWLVVMERCFEDRKIGAVGAKLLYPDGTIQHAGVMLEKKRLAIHAFRTWKECAVKYGNNKRWSAVTAACMMTRKDLFLESGGFDEKNLPIAYNDVDYCLRLKNRGYGTVCVNDARLYHLESASRRSDIFSKILNRKRYKKFMEEQGYMRKKWKNEIENDLFYNADYI